MKEKSVVEPVKSDLILYQTENGQTRVEIRLQDETVWMNDKLMAELFQKDIRTVNEHVTNLDAEGELILAALSGNSG